MSSDNGFAAHSVAERIPKGLAAPWELFAQRIRRYEVHLVGRRIELLRGPLTIDGYGLRVLRSGDGLLRVGVASSTDPSSAGVARVVEEAESVARYASFPTPSVELPARAPESRALDLVDPAIRDRPEEAMGRFCEELLGEFDRYGDPLPSFGSIRVGFAENSLANSSGETAEWAGTLAEFEFAVRSVAESDGAAPGEYWVNTSSRCLDPKRLGVDVPRWARLAREMRGAKAPASGSLTVGFASDVLAEIVPPIVGVRLSGFAELRGVAPPIGASVGSPLVHLSDEPFLPWAVGSAPFDDEGSAHRPLPLIQGGEVKSILYDLLYGAKFGHPSTGHGRRNSLLGAPHRFASGVSPGSTNLQLAVGDGGSREELIESIGDGIWLEQLGYPFPDPIGGSYGGEIRAAYRVRHGKLAEPLRGGTVGGLLLGAPEAESLLKGITHVGSHTETWGAYSGPPVVAEKIAVAGPS